MLRADRMLPPTSSNRSNGPVPPLQFVWLTSGPHDGASSNRFPRVEVERRCADRERRASYHTRLELKQLDWELDHAASEIETELGRLEGLHMEDWSARFSHALALDVIGPDDLLTPWTRPGSLSAARLTRRQHRERPFREWVEEMRAAGANGCPGSVARDPPRVRRHAVNDRPRTSPVRRRRRRRCATTWLRLAENINPAAGSLASWGVACDHGSA